MMATTIGVYVDDGASLATIIRSITQEVHASYIVRSVVAVHLDYDPLLDEFGVFVMPGGADLPYCAKLAGRRNARLRSWVERGGVYLGLCAGAYYGCRKLNFHGHDGEISGSRELAFLNGTAVGSIQDLAPLYDFTLKSAAVAPLITNRGESTAAFYHGGPYFEIEGDAKATVLARYATVKEEPPAIVESTVGRGKALLCGVHPEMSSSELELEIRTLDNPALHVSYDRLLSDLKAAESKRRKLWRMLLTSCGLLLSS
jgi:glutamine amidotransferase-like uncharacterized protein